MTTKYPTEESVLHDDEEGESFELDLDDLNLTSEDIDFDEIDDDLDRFQEDEMVQQALHRGVDLRKYGLELAAQLKEVERDMGPCVVCGVVVLCVGYLCLVWIDLLVLSCVVWSGALKSVLCCVVLSDMLC